MTATGSRTLELGTIAPHFALFDTKTALVCIDDFWESRALLVAFTCDHCPYTRHIQGEFVALADEYRARGVATVAIMPNDAEQRPQDGPDAIRKEHAAGGYGFPYLHDETQQVARAYGVECTPDFFLFDADRSLVYHGQFDGSRPDNGIPVTGSDLRAALDALIENRPIPAEQVPSTGCGIAWKPALPPPASAGL